MSTQLGPRPARMSRLSVAIVRSTASLRYEGPKGPPPYDLQLREALQALFPPGCGYAGVLTARWNDDSQAWSLSEARRMREYHPPEDMTDLLIAVLRERGLPVERR